MKYIPFLFVIFSILQSCAGNDETNKNGDNSDNAGNQTPSIDPNGPEVEVIVLGFDLEKSETTIEIINRMDEPITSIGGRLFFYDENGMKMSTATSANLSSPFQTAQNPYVVESMASVKKVLKNTIPSGTGSIKVEEISGKTRSGSF